MNHWVNVGTGCVCNPYSEIILRSLEWLCVKRHQLKFCGVSMGVLGTISDGCTDYKHVLQQALQGLRTYYRYRRVRKRHDWHSRIKDHLAFRLRGNDLVLQRYQR